ncbi:hypothetical protein V6N12_065046 [Hibiscus sabdariffa]|uniref:Uncharacterized protein n=1 Tax=Hibiscus sabdariffa TaxID=183260 RepID=A0ABR2G7J5_9ROSI
MRPCLQRRRKGSLQTISSQNPSLPSMIEDEDESQDQITWALALALLKQQQITYIEQEEPMELRIDSAIDVYLKERKKENSWDMALSLLSFTGSPILGFIRLHRLHCVQSSHGEERKKWVGSIYKRGRGRGGA